MRAKTWRYDKGPLLYKTGGMDYMAADRPMLASDDDRDRVVEILREQTAQGRLTFEEFEERIGRAYTARTWDELRALVDDLPVRVVFAADDRSATNPAGRNGFAERARKAAVPVRPQVMLLPVLVFAVLLGVAVADAWSALPFLLIGVFWFAAGPCGRRGGRYACGTQATRITPPRGR